MAEPYIIIPNTDPGSKGYVRNSDPDYAAFWNRTQDKDALIALILGHVEMEDCA